jgi:hypothetical protein
MATANKTQTNQLAAYRASQIATAIALASTGDGKSAERALMQIAEAQGDIALSKALSQVPGATIMTILTAVGTKHSSVVPALITPKQFAKAVEDLPKAWIAHGASMEYGIQELLEGVILRPDLETGEVGTEAGAFFKALGESSVAQTMLAIAFYDHGEEILQYQKTKSFDGSAKSDSAEDIRETDWKYAVYTMRKTNPNLFQQVCIGLSKDHMALLDELKPTLQVATTETADESAL